MSPPDDAPSFLTTAASIVGVGSSRNTRNDAGVAGAAVALTHDPLAALRLHCRTCRSCKTVVARMSDLNDNMVCSECGKPDEDAEGTIDLSDGAMVREHGTWRL